MPTRSLLNAALIWCLGRTVVIDAQQRATQAKAVQAQTQATLQASNAYRVGNVLGQVFLAARYILLSSDNGVGFSGRVAFSTAQQFTMRNARKPK